MPRPKNKPHILKCKQCRKDKQKCLPLGRTWPGARCDRCKKFSYSCSASLSLAEEFGSQLPSEPIELPTAPRKTKNQCLQEIGDLDNLLRMMKAAPIPSASPLSSMAQATESKLQEQLRTVLADTRQLVKQFQADGLWSDAEYLFRRSQECSDSKYQAPTLRFGDDTDLPPSMASMYELLGDLPHAQTVQEAYIDRFRIVMTQKQYQEETKRLFQLYRLFLSRCTMFQNHEGDTFGKHLGTAYILRQVAILNLPLAEDPPLLQIPSERDWNAEQERLFILQLAVAYARPVQLDQLLLYGLSPRSFSDPFIEVSCLLREAVSQDSEETMMWLLRNGMHIDATDLLTSSTALHLAARAGNTSMCGLLLQFGANIEAVDIHDWTALFHAIDAKEHKMCDFLLSRRAKLNASLPDGETALHLAVRSKRLATCLLLLERNANINATNKYGYTALHWAVTYKDYGICQLLLDRDDGTLINTQTSSGSTALHLAAISGDHQICHLLLEYRADQTIRDGNGQTAKTVARNVKDLPMYHLLAGQGASHPPQALLLLNHALGLN